MTYLQLLEELESLTDEQLAMPALVYISDPCDPYVYDELCDVFSLEFGIRENEEQPVLVI